MKFNTLGFAFDPLFIAFLNYIMGIKKRCVKMILV